MGLALEEPEEKDMVELNGLKVMMDATVKGFSDGQILDYIDNSDGNGFVFKSEQGGC